MGSRPRGRAPQSIERLSRRTPRYASLSPGGAASVPRRGPLYRGPELGAEVDLDCAPITTPGRRCGARCTRRSRRSTSTRWSSPANRFPCRRRRRRDAARPIRSRLPNGCPARQRSGCTECPDECDRCAGVVNKSVVSCVVAPGAPTPGSVAPPAPQQQLARAPPRCLGVPGLCRPEPITKDELKTASCVTRPAPEPPSLQTHLA